MTSQGAGRATAGWTLGLVAYGVEVVVSVVIAWTRQYWSLVLAMASTPLVPLVAFSIMQEVVTA